MTGILFTLDTLPGKQIEMALKAVSGVATVGMLVNTNNLAVQIPRAKRHGCCCCTRGQACSRRRA